MCLKGGVGDESIQTCKQFTTSSAESTRDEGKKDMNLLGIRKGLKYAGQRYLLLWEPTCLCNVS